MPATLTTRLERLEDALLRRQVRDIAAEHGIDADELLAGAKQLAIEERRLRRQGLSEREVRQGLVVWVAADT